MINDVSVLISLEQAVLAFTCSMWSSTACTVLLLVLTCAGGYREGNRRLRPHRRVQLLAVRRRLQRSVRKSVLEINRRYGQRNRERTKLRITYKWLAWDDKQVNWTPGFLHVFVYIYSDFLVSLTKLYLCEISIHASAEQSSFWRTTGLAQEWLAEISLSSFVGLVVRALWPSSSVDKVLTGCM